MAKAQTPGKTIKHRALAERSAGQVGTKTKVVKLADKPAGVKTRGIVGKVQARDRAARPRLDAPAPRECLAFEPDPSVIDRWNPAVRAAAEGDDNIISMYGPIGEDMWSDAGWTARRVAGILRRIGARELTVNINSPGGDFFEGIAIYNLLREHPAKVTIQVVGVAASAASIIAMAGDDVLVARAGFLMIHNAMALAFGNRNDMIEAAAFLEPFDQAMAGLYAARTGMSEKEVAALMDKETWISGQQAVDQRFADGLLASDAVKEVPEAVAQSKKTLRRADAALARAGMPRNERRSLLHEIRGGTQDAAATVGANPGTGEALTATQDAGAPQLQQMSDLVVSLAASSAISILKGASRHG
jgi:ATP-dependent Clp protease protease subunit